MSVPAGSGGSFPLTTAQLGVCLAHHLGPDGSTYNLAKYVEILGPVDPAAFEAALLQAGRECGAFDIRLVLAEDGRTPAQEVRPTSQTPRFVDLTGEADPESAAQDWMDADWRAPVDLMDGSLFTDVLFRVEGERYFWYSRCHHVLVDGYGDELLTRRIAALYTAAVLGDSAALAGSAFQGGPRELVADEEAYRASPRYTEDRAYWVSRFADLPPVPQLGATAPEQVTGTGLRRRSRLSAPDLDRLRAAAREGHTTWTVLLAAAVAAYLRTATGLDEVTVGIPVTGRRPATLRTPGMLANELPLRVDVSPWQTKRELLRQVAGGLSDLLRRQHYPYDDLRRELGVEEPLFGPTLNIFSFEEKLTFGGLPTVQHRLANGPVRDLNITVSVGAASGIGDGLLIDFDANPTVYGPAEVEAHQRHFLALLNSLVEAGPEVPVGRIGVLGAAERAEVLARSTGAPVTGAPASVLDMFTAQVERTPDAPAVIADDQDLTYRQLDEQAGQLAAAIRPRLHGVEPRVAILLERSSRTVITALAVLKAGGVYVPLDHHAPHERHTTVLAQADAQLLITDRPHPTDLPVLDPDARGTAGDTGAVHPDALACVLFTSGSTGIPKGVALTHRGITDLVRDHGFSGAANRILLHASPAFDASVYETWTPLLNGGTVVVAPPGDLDADVLQHAIRTHRVTALLLTAGLFRLIARETPEALHGLQEIWSGGDTVPATEVQRILDTNPDITVVDAYGPAESTVIATRHPVTTHDHTPTTMPIGLPLDGMHAYLLDANLHPVPDNTNGELYLAGCGLARGYLGQYGQTAERFLPDPFGPPGTRMYRTGDTARWTNSTLTFTGRTDDQVKIRGYRIELAEIETTLSTHPTVAQAVVLAHQHTNGSKQLIAYIVPVKGARLDTDALRAHTAEHLPDYMVPGWIGLIDALPLTRNGKVDRAALPAPEPVADRAGRPSADDRERLLCTLFAEVLDLPTVFADDSFFSLGGDSIISIQLSARARKEGLALTPRDVFTHKTPEALAAAVPDLADVQELPFTADDPALALDQDELDELEAEWELSQ